MEEIILDLTALKYRLYLGCVGTPLISEGLFSEMKHSQPSAWLSLCTSQNTRRYLKQTKTQSVVFLQPRQKFLTYGDSENLDAESSGLAVGL